MPVVARFIGNAGIRNRLARMGGQVNNAVGEAMKPIAQRGASVVREKVYTPPGPDRGDGGLQDSIEGRWQATGTGGRAAIGTDIVYGPRLEFGFYDMEDSLGRRFFQNPTPFLGPRTGDIAAIAQEELGSRIRRAV